MRRLPLFEALRVRSPCSESFEDMSETDSASRFCDRCRRHVHDVASLTRAEAEDLVESYRRRGGRPCLFVHVRRRDGAVLLADGHVVPEGSLRRPGLAARAVATASAVAIAACTPASHQDEHAAPSVSVSVSSPAVLPSPSPAAPDPSSPAAASSEPVTAAPSSAPVASASATVAAGEKKKPATRATTPATKHPKRAEYDLLSGF